MHVSGDLLHWTSFSTTLQITGTLVIGRKLDDCEGSPILWRGITTGHFQLLGTNSETMLELMIRSSKRPM